jgi:denticleless
MTAVDEVRLKKSVHNNAIFDLAWNRDDSEIITTSGDQKVHVSDAETAALKHTLIGQSGSVKCLDVDASNPDFVLSAGREGNITLHDVREKGNEKEENLPVWCVHQSHAPVRSKVDSKKRYRFGTRGSVTSVKFVPDSRHVMSSGATDGLVKLWDLRMTRKIPKPVAEFNPCKRDKCTRNHGIHSLDITPDGSRILVGSLNNK